MTMTDAQRKAIRTALQERVVEAAKNPEKARARLIREGFYTDKGELTAAYGGKQTASR